jgi:hypothetical protein
MAKSREGGVWREALTAGLVTAIITAFELYAIVWKLEWVIEKPNWSWALVLALAFAAAFFLVWLINKLLDLLQAKNRRQPIELESIGKVNGYWIDAIRDHPDQKPIQVSIFELSSTQHDGSSANGTSYPANNGCEEFGAFKTTQSNSMKNGFIYFFEGEERRSGDVLGKRHEGVGFYAFSRVNNKLRVRGAFLAFNETSTRHLTGRKLTENEWEDAQDETKRSHLIQRFLAEKPF